MIPLKDLDSIVLSEEPPRNGANVKQVKVRITNIIGEQSSHFYWDRLISVVNGKRVTHLGVYDARHGPTPVVDEEGVRTQYRCQLITEESRHLAREIYASSNEEPKIMYRWLSNGSH